MLSGQIPNYGTFTTETPTILLLAFTTSTAYEAWTTRILKFINP